MNHLKDLTIDFRDSSLALFYLDSQIEPHEVQLSIAQFPSAQTLIAEVKRVFENEEE